MFLAIRAIAEALAAAPHFQSWDVRDGLSTVSRKDFPAVDVRLADGSVTDSIAASAKVEPIVAVTLAVQRGADAAATLDAAFCQAIASLQGLSVKDASGGKWSYLQLQRVRDTIVPDGIAGCELLFTFARRFDGLACNC